MRFIHDMLSVLGSVCRRMNNFIYISFCQYFFSVDDQQKNFLFFAVDFFFNIFFPSIFDSVSQLRPIKYICVCCIFCGRLVLSLMLITSSLCSVHIQQKKISSMLRIWSRNLGENSQRFEHEITDISTECQSHFSVLFSFFFFVSSFTSSHYIILVVGFSFRIGLSLSLALIAANQHYLAAHNNCVVLVALVDVDCSQRVCTNSTGRVLFLAVKLSTITMANESSFLFFRYNNIDSRATHVHTM